MHRERKGVSVIRLLLTFTMSQEQVLFRMAPRIANFVMIQVEEQKTTAGGILLSEGERMPAQESSESL